ncbi:SDR family NAD(P)-dependent oxidoreductase [Aggregatilinea lenta]|uniref:SDR family NAD(P)-dependent oxidoreductase n=1 Tax=Aggregatilinea lenta TaxID=913108 RepID=UPI000E5A5018|nr:SDR family oxidoreductase [Aggregatilinea lenta]
MRIDPGLKGRVVLITGANQGIGAATAKAFAALGAHVFVHYFRLLGDPAASGDTSMPGAARHAADREQGADAVLDAIRAYGVQAAAAEADLSDPASIPALFERVEAGLGPVEILVNNSASWQADTFVPSGAAQFNTLPELWSDHVTGTLTPASIDAHFAVNSRALALMMAEFARRHRARGATWGRIINLSTGGAYVFPGEVSYGASKAALEAYSRSAAKELGQFGITVNVVSPGPTQTGWITPALEETLLPSIPMGRIGQPEDIASAIVFFASEQAGYITGQLLHVGGGQTV